MRLCIPAADDKGLEAKTFAHFGSAPFYAIADTDTDQVEMIENKHHEHGHGGCGQVGRLRSRGIDALVCRDLGRRAYAMLHELGIDVYTSDRQTVRDVVTEWRAGKLERPSLDQLCAGHGQGHEHRERHRQQE